MTPLSRREFRLIRRGDLTALKKQAIEYERRMENLNGEQSRIAAAASASVRRDVYDGDQRNIDQRLKMLEAAEDKRSGATRLLVILAAMGVVSGAIGLGGVVIQWIKLSSSNPSPQVYYVPAAPGTLVPSPQQPQQPRQ
jgi:hypothetical protein